MATAIVLACGLLACWAAYYTGRLSGRADLVEELRDADAYRRLLTPGGGLVLRVVGADKFHEWVSAALFRGVEQALAEARDKVGTFADDLVLERKKNCDLERQAAYLEEVVTQAYAIQAADREEILRLQRIAVEAARFTYEDHVSLHVEEHMHPRDAASLTVEVGDPVPNSADPIHTLWGNL